MNIVGKWFGFGKDANFDDGLRAYENRAYAEAVDAFQKCVQSDVELALRERARSYAAGSLAKLGKSAYDYRNFEAALNYFDQAAEIRPGFADIWLGKANTEKALGQLSAAEESLRQSLEINPNYSAAILLRGIISYKLGHYDDGLRQIQDAIKRDSRLDGTEFAAGLVRHEEGDFPAALECFEQIEPRGGDVNDLLVAGDQAAKHGEWQKAADLFKYALEYAPGYADVHVRYGQALLEQAKLAEALQSFQRAIAINPDYAEAYALMGVTYRRQGDEDNSLTAFRRALDIDPHHPIASQEVLYRRR